MARMPDEVKDMVDKCKPVFVATASKDGKPNVSAKGSIIVVDDEHVAFADVMSPRTVANLKENPQVALTGHDTATRSGYRMSGRAQVATSGPLFDQYVQKYASRFTVKHVVTVAVEESSAYKM